MTVEHYVYPVLNNMRTLSFFDSLMELLCPFMVHLLNNPNNTKLIYFMIFYIIFEGVCNIFAELTLFADRDFYSDWWNSTSFDEYGTIHTQFQSNIKHANGINQYTSSF